MTSLALVLSIASLALEPPAPANVHTVSLGVHNFTLPVGFEIELVAGPPLVDRPIHADFDVQGRLYVCESSGTNDKVEKQLADKPHWILRLEDTDGDGRFDRRTKFADQMMFPEGMLWHDGSVYCAAPPSIWKLTDTDDDGVADRREEWFQGKTLTGCANDLHGPYAGPDGWIYWCKGAFAEQRYERPGRPPLVTRAAHMFRCRPDGSGLEPVMTGGMDNPIEVIFTPGGERIFTTTFLQHPGGGKRDGLIHAIYGGVYGKQHDVLDGHPRTGELMPPMTHFGAAAPAGLARYESSVFGPEYRDNLFAALFNMHKVTRHVLTAAGATFASRDEDFLVSDNLDFHPTDVFEDADGSLIVVDTGGWYKLCCPTSQLWKPQILGGIYRVRRRGAPAVEDPRGLVFDWKAAAPRDLVSLLADQRPAVARRAIRALHSYGTAAVEPVVRVRGENDSPVARARAVWTLTQIGTAAARAEIRQALGDRDEAVRQVAIHSVSVARDADAVPQLIELLRTGTPHNRRAAAEALGRIGDPSAAPALLAVAGEDLDRTLEHSVTFALIEIAAPAPTQKGLSSATVGTRRAALLALAQMADGGLEPAAVAALWGDKDPPIRQTTAWVLSQHPDWADTLTPWFESQLAAGGLTGAEAASLAGLCARFAHSGPVQSLLAGRLEASAAGSPERRAVLDVMARSALPSLPPRWAAALAGTLRSDDELVLATVAVVRAASKLGDGAADLRDALLAAAANERLPTAVRLEALGAVPGGLTEVAPQQFDFIRRNLSPETPISVRVAAADVVSQARLDDRQLLALAEDLRGAGPLEIERLLVPFGKSGSDKVGRAMIGALAASPALANVRPETLQEVFKNSSPEVRSQSQELVRIQAAGAAQRLAKIEELLTLVAGGDVHRGQLVFNSQKAACATCHEIGYLGGTAGPDLTKIGEIRGERDLLESILFPSASFVRSYEPITVSTNGGKVYTGTLQKDSPEEVILTLNAKDTVRIPREEIDQMQPAAVSIMPAGLDQQLSSQELADLIAFLRACK